jgi:hypothetical protein
MTFRNLATGATAEGRRSHRWRSEI